MDVPPAPVTVVPLGGGLGKKELLLDYKRCGGAGNMCSCGDPCINRIGSELGYSVG